MINKTFLAFAAPERNRRAIFHSTSIADWGGELLLGRVGKCNGLENYPCGAVFKLTTSGKISRLYQYNGPTVISGIPLPISGTDGPNAAVILDSSGNLYGTTPFQGTAGIVYVIEAGGKVKRLYSFPPSNWGTYPWAGLKLNPSGNLYGMEPLSRAAVRPTRVWFSSSAPAERKPCCTPSKVDQPTEMDPRLESCSISPGTSTELLPRAGQAIGELSTS